MVRQVSQIILVRQVNHCLSMADFRMGRWKYLDEVMQELRDSPGQPKKDSQS